MTGLWSSHGAILADAESVEGITKTIRWAKQAGIPRVHTGDGRKPDSMSEEAALATLGERLREPLEVAEESQVELLIEPHGTFSLTAEGLGKVLKLSLMVFHEIGADESSGAAPQESSKRPDMTYPRRHLCLSVDTQGVRP